MRLALDGTLLRAGERVCCAVSGGADSTALLLALTEANAVRDAQGAGMGLTISAAHVHHGMRGPEADQDEAFVRESCARLNVPLTVFHVDTAARQESHGQGREEAARELRYEALRGLLRSGAADAVATAHNLEDQAETVAMKLLRGAWTEGLGGISPVVEERAEGEGALGRRVRFVRPLLGVRRREVEEFLTSRGQPWREDGSNRDLSLTRNRVRHELMPLLRSFNPGIDQSLARMAALARDEEAFWQGESARLLPQVLLPGRPVRGGGRAVSTAVGEASCAVEIARLNAMSLAMRRRMVRAVARSLGGPEQGSGCRLNAEETAAVLALGGLGGQAGLSGGFDTGPVKGRIGSRLELSGGLRVERSARELRFWRQRSRPDAASH